MKVGDRVAYASDRPRAYCAGGRDAGLAAAASCPDAIDDETAAALVLKGLTAQYLIRGAYPVRPARRS